MELQPQSSMDKNYSALEQFNNFVRDILNNTSELSEIPDSYKNTQRSSDLEGLTLTFKGEHHISLEFVNNEESDDQDLIRRIHQYNKDGRTPKKDRSSSRRSRKNNEGGKPQRKVRTTITPDKLEEMNRIFKQYEKLKEVSSNQNESQVDKEINCNLKAIGEKLGLGYSTILHKYREYRATKKVKGGALLLSLNQKRKYKKSKEIEDLIEKSLAQGKFYTAVDLSKHIQKEFGKNLSRSIISRHLGQMGYSYKNAKTKNSLNQCQQIKQIRKKFTTVVKFLRERQNNEVYYIGQIFFSPQGSTQTEVNIFQHLNITIFLSSNGLLKYAIQSHHMYQDEFLNFVRESVDIMNHQSTNPKIIVLDLENNLHISEGVKQIRAQIIKKDIKILYLPPNSPQLSLLQWVGQTIKNQINYHSISHDEIWEKLQSILSHTNEVKDEMSKVLAYERKALKMENFD